MVARGDNPGFAFAATMLSLLRKVFMPRMHEF